VDDADRNSIAGVVDKGILLNSSTQNSGVLRSHPKGWAGEREMMVVERQGASAVAATLLVRSSRLGPRSSNILSLPLTMALVVDLLIIVVALTVSLVITVPITGALVRLRANYNPKGLQLDDEGVVHPYTGPQLTSFLGMLARVKRLEVRPC